MTSSFLYYYKAVVVKVYDGDTITCDIDLGMNIILRNQKIRMFGINTPEIRTKDLEEKKRGYAARDRLRELVLGKTVTLHTHKDKGGKFGRLLGIVMTDVDVNDLMMKEGHAIPYMG